MALAMNCQQRLREIVLAGGALTATACSVLTAGLALSVVACGPSSGAPVRAFKSSTALQLDNPPPFTPDYLGAEGCSETTNGVTMGARCFGNLDDAVVFDCASQASTSAGCTAMVVCPEGGSACSYTMTVWYPCAASAPYKDANCCYLPAAGYGNTPLTAWCVSTGSNSFIIAEQSPGPQ